MYQKRRRRRRSYRRFPHIIATLLFLAFITVVLCGLSNPAADAEPEIPTPAISDTYETIPLKPDPVIVPPVSIPYETMLVSEPTPEPEPEEKFRYYDHISLEYDLQELLWAACEETGCPYELALAVIFRESTYRNVNGDNGNSIGYMQVQPRWHYERMERLGVTDLSDPLSNFRVGCDLLTELIEKYGSVESALTCYNTGSPGTSKYADRVLAYMNETFFAQEVENE